MCCGNTKSVKRINKTVRRSKRTATKIDEINKNQTNHLKITKINKV